MKTDINISEQDLKRIQEFRLLDDDFMTKVFDGQVKETELVLRIILQMDDLKVISVTAQQDVRNLQGRSARFDVYAVDSKGQLYNIEIQRADKGAGAKRARYNSSLIDSNTLLPGNKHEQLPETYVVFITESDVLGDGLPVYHIERIIQETGKLFDDKAHIVYANGAYKDDESEIGRLMHDFRETDPAKMHNKILADRVSYFKNSEEGRSTMCRAMEEMRNEAVKERDKGQIEMLLRKGWSSEQIHQTMEYSIDLIDEVEKEISVQA